LGFVELSLEDLEDFEALWDYHFLLKNYFKKLIYNIYVLKELKIFNLSFCFIFIR